MELNNEFVINKAIDQAWPILTDLERIAPCMPGAQLTEVEGDVYRGFVKIKVGPIGAQFKGEAKFVSKDDANHNAQLKADGRDTKGNGNASALITAGLEAIDAASCKCTVHTDLSITGKVAQFGRGVLPEISKNLINQFAENLNEMITNDPGSASSATENAESAAVATESPETAPSAGEMAGSAAATASAAPAAPTLPGVRKIDSKPVEALEVGSIIPTRFKVGVPIALVAIGVIIWLIAR